MQHPLELGAARYFPAEAFPDHRSHRYRSFMIEEILTDPPDAKGAAPAGELLKFGVQALLSARPYHNHLGTSRGAPRGWGAAGGGRRGGIARRWSPAPLGAGFLGEKLRSSAYKSC